MVKMYLADRRRGPVGDYQGLASFNLAPPPHQATGIPGSHPTVALQFIIPTCAFCILLQPLYYNCQIYVEG